MSICRRATRVLPALFLAAALTSANAQSAPSLTVALPNQAALTLGARELAQLPRVSGVVDFHGSRVAYEGVEVAAVLRAAGMARTDSLRGPALQLVVRFVGADGYAAVIALSDLDPSIGARRVILVDREDNAPVAGERGPFRVIIEGDRRASRWVRQVVRIEVLSVANL